MAKKAPQEPVRPIIVKKVIEAAHAGHHGGAWKVAYADFVTAMMAFFLLMWLIGATTEKQRKSIADYFAPTLITNPGESAGGFGPLGGDSIQSTNKLDHGSERSIIQKPLLAVDIGKTLQDDNRRNFHSIQKDLEKTIKGDKDLKKLLKNIRFTETREGLRIDMVDDADFSMFFTGSTKMTTQAAKLLRAVEGVVSTKPHPLIIRGHTDSAPWSAKSGGNNWRLSTSRAEATRRFLNRMGMDKKRVARIEGVADTEPYIPSDPYDSRNRRISITLGWVKAP